MISFLEYPFNSQMILRKRKALRKQLMVGTHFRKINIAVLGGSTTSEFVNVLELFLLKIGLFPNFYESEYNKYYEDAIFGNSFLSSFKPDIIYIHTTQLNITSFPTFDSNNEKVESLFQVEINKFKNIWKSLEIYSCPIIQNNFDFPINRSLGNLDCYDIHGKTFFLNRLNLFFSSEAQVNKSLFINDINYLSASMGLNKWFDKVLWFNAKYAISFEAIPYLANNLTNIIVGIFGLSKKCLVLDLDNTCWGGVIGDDGLNGIKLGNETPEGEAYLAFQKYVKELKERGIILAVCSKNEIENAIEGFKHSESILKFSDFTSFYANWQPKYENIEKIAEEINIDINSLVLVDDNAMERNLAKLHLNTLAVPDVGENILNFIDHLEYNGYFSVSRLTVDDFKRNTFYFDNQRREQEKSVFKNYDEFLISLKMEAKIQIFKDIYFERITQLINKTNQFNLTTKRYTILEVEAMANNNDFISLFGKLSDKFGDNGIISVIIGKIEGKSCHIDTWLMSCRVFKRDMEFAMFDEIVEECKKRNLTEIIGYYKRTSKNKIVANLFDNMGFQVIENNEEEGKWKLYLLDYCKKKINIKTSKYD
jgi:FkbH-like protein